ncbi:uncharacterized protein TNCV_4139011 [Trichonephila clavipes]|nr:uncharacterized protein TNCV_4139011 [Trichonephila clavipes]
MDEILTTARGLELEVNEDDIEELIMEHEDELTTEKLQEILNEEHQETQRNVSPFEQEEQRRPMLTSAIKDILKKWEAVRAMVLEWHPNQADVSRAREDETIKPKRRRGFKNKSSFTSPEQEILLEPSSHKSSREVGGRGREVGGLWTPAECFLLNWGRIEPNRTVTSMVLKSTANDRRHLALCHDEFRESPSGLYRSGGTDNNNNNDEILNLIKSLRVASEPKPSTRHYQLRVGSHIHAATATIQEVGNYPQILGIMRYLKNREINILNKFLQKPIKVMDSWLGCHEFEPEVPPYRGSQYPSNIPRLNHLPAGAEIRREGCQLRCRPLHLARARKNKIRPE